MRTRQIPDTQGGMFTGTDNSPATLNRPFWAELTSYDSTTGHYAWTEQVNTPSGFTALAGGKVGTTLIWPAFDPNGAVLTVGDVVLLQRSYYDPTYDWKWVVVAGGGNAGNLTMLGITNGTVTGRTNSFTLTTFLTTDMTSSQTTVPVASTVALPEGYVLTLLIDNEEMRVLVTSGVVNVICRGVNGTGASSHSSGASVYRVRLTYGSGTVHLIMAAQQSDGSWDEADTCDDQFVLNPCDAIDNGTFVQLYREPYSGQMMVHSLCTVPTPGSGSGSGSGGGCPCPITNTYCIVGGFPGLTNGLSTGCFAFTDDVSFTFYTNIVGGCIWASDVDDTGFRLYFQISTDGLSADIYWSNGTPLYSATLEAPWDCESEIVFTKTVNTDFLCNNWPSTVTLSKGPCPGSGSGGGGSANLVGWWKLNEGSGTTLYDYSGNNLALTGFSGAWSVDTPGSQAGAGGSVEFTSNDTSTYGSSTSLLPLTDSPRTVSFWYKISGSAAMSFTYGTSRSAAFYRRTLDTLTFTEGGGLGNDGSASAAAPTGGWYFYTFTTDGTNWVYYEDGTPNNSGTFATPPLSTGASDVSLSVSGTSSWQYNIKDMRVYDVELSAADVASLYAGTFGP